jgi:outer membrane immunogenic protein
VPGGGPESEGLNEKIPSFWGSYRGARRAKFSTCRRFRSGSGLQAPPVAAPVPIFTWTGCYIGGHIGGAWANTKFLDPFDGSTIAEVSPSAFLGGGQVGCNYQAFPNFVLGVEGNISGTDLHATAAGPVFPPATVSDTLSAKTDWIASVTGRIGFAWDRWLLYVKGGGAWAHYRYRDFGDFGLIPIGFPDTFNFSASETRVGWTVGVGLEWAFWNNWSVRLEYDHYDLGSRDVTLFDPVLAATPGAAGGGTETLTIKDRIDAVKFGINYLFSFGKGKGPVVARY